MDGTPVRLAGQDSRRGTFVQRHVLIDKNTAEWTPLLYLGEGRPSSGSTTRCCQYRDGLQYGYSVEAPMPWSVGGDSGDFANGAQTILGSSQFRAEVGSNSSVVLLPHGYEARVGHSSARIERFLTLCAQRT